MDAPMRRINLTAVLVALLAGVRPGGLALPASSVITGISWDPASYVFAGVGGDLWPITWAADDSVRASYGDGPTGCPVKVSYGTVAITTNPPSLALQGVGCGPAGTNQGKIMALGAAGSVLFGRMGQQSTGSPPPDRTLDRRRQELAEAGLVAGVRDRRLRPVRQGQRGRARRLRLPDQRHQRHHGPADPLPGGQVERQLRLPVFQRHRRRPRLEQPAGREKADLPRPGRRDAAHAAIRAGAQALPADGRPPRTRPGRGVRCAQRVRAVDDRLLCRELAGAGEARRVLEHVFST